MSAEHVRSDWVEIPAGKWGRVPSSEIENRIARAQAGLARAGIELALVVQNADLYYLTGTIQQGQLLLPAQGEPVLLVRKDLNRARQESPLPRVKAISSLRELPGAVAAMGMSEAFVLGMELDVLPVNVFRRYEALFPKAVVRDVSPVIREVRTVKSEYERALMAEAAAMVDSVVQTVAGILREGMTEVELSAHCEFALRAAGYQGLARYRAFNQEWSYSHVFS
ncbi:MAG: aminopeptidase P family N-terminal domain-containing protein, partial [Thermoleophilia bacterium]|nr:aminopeptidase P family N-terminal domain-containing protein [Thermoleophilia bacterium]